MLLYELFEPFDSSYWLFPTCALVDYYQSHSPCVRIDIPGKLPYLSFDRNESEECIKRCVKAYSRTTPSTRNSIGTSAHRT